MFSHNLVLFSLTAGGVAATVNADYLRQKLTSVKSLHLVVDAGLFIDQTNQHGEHFMQNVFKNVYYLHNVQGKCYWIVVTCQ